MPAHDPFNAFYLFLEEFPGDTATLLALADWFEEHDDLSAAECIRWSARRKRYPFRYAGPGALSVAGIDWHDGWFWWATDDPGIGNTWGHSQECRLPARLWGLLRHGHNAPPYVFKEYLSLRQAYEALITAWPRAQPLERERRP